MSDLKCPYAKALAQGFDIHIDCLDCPSIGCKYPEIKQRFFEKWNNAREERERDDG